VKTIKKDDECFAGQFPIGSVDNFMMREFINRERELANEQAVKVRDSCICIYCIYHLHPMTGFCIVK
jgi:hypothetical protein